MPEQGPSLINQEQDNPLIIEQGEQEELSLETAQNKLKRILEMTGSNFAIRFVNLGEYEAMMKNQSYSCEASFYKNADLTAVISQGFTPSEAGEMTDWEASSLGMVRYKYFTDLLDLQERTHARFRELFFKREDLIDASGIGLEIKFKNIFDHKRELDKIQQQLEPAHQFIVEGATDEKTVRQAIQGMSYFDEESYK